MNNCIENNKPNNYKLIITKTLEEKIRLMCSKSWDTEWSGILFYKVEGDFSTDDLKIKCIDCKILDIGTSGSTEFIIDEKVCSYMVDNDLTDCYTGLIHSHNKLNTFFSATDLDTLASEGQDTNNFVSLIVNNKGEYTAAITRKIKIKEHKKDISYTLFGKQVNQLLVVEDRELIEYTKLKVVITRTSQVYNSVLEDIEDIKVKKEKEKETRKKQEKKVNLFKTNNNNYIDWKLINQFLFDQDKNIYTVQDLVKAINEEVLKNDGYAWYDDLMEKIDTLSYNTMLKLKNSIEEISKYEDIPLLTDLFFIID